MFWELHLLFRISWRGPHIEMAGFLFLGLKVHMGTLTKKIILLSQFFPCEKNSWNSELFSDPICPFSICWVKVGDIMIMFYNGSIYDKRLIYSKFNVFSHVLDTNGFPMKRKLIRSNSVLVCVCVSGSTVM
jgi:hypothetical protein